MIAEKIYFLCFLVVCEECGRKKQKLAPDVVFHCWVRKDQRSLTCNVIEIKAMLINYLKDCDLISRFFVFIASDKDLIFKILGLRLF